MIASETEAEGEGQRRGDKDVKRKQIIKKFLRTLTELRSESKKRRKGDRKRAYSTSKIVEIN